MKATPSELVNCWPYWPKIELPIRSRGVPFTMTSVRKLRLPAVASATFSSGMLTRCTCAGGVAVPQRRRDGERGVETARDVPGGQYVVDRDVESGGPGDERKADARVDGVVDAGAAVGAPGHLHVDEVGPQLDQRLVRMPLAASHIGDEDAGVDDEPLDQPLPLARIARRSPPNACPC